MTTQDAKAALRKKARLGRAGLARAAGGGAGDAAARNFLDSLSPADDTAISGYWPVGDEFDVRPLLARLHERGHVCCLPVVVGKNRPLIFRRWEPGDVLRPAALGIPVPSPEADEVIPSVLLVPMLAFDARGYRLGYGGGFYDMTIKALRAQAATIAVGMAFAGQEMDAVPTDEHDERLDWIVTEKAATRVA
ncbi:MAG: 5-formyltetrahydrofolate cyclo-ligase [Alphaproteobacteria bacterium]|nr:5-formyltetrahydrofolate cyclo-ligase [Alphaproteobacteria bacterium]